MAAALLALTTDWVALVDGTACLRRPNAAMTAAFGAAVPGTPAAALIAPHADAGQRDAYAALLDGREGGPVGPIPFAAVDGTRWGEARLASLAPGMAMRLLVVRDVTELHRLQRTNDRIALAAQAAGLGTWELDLDTGVALWDEQMFRLRGLDRPAGPVDATERAALVHPDDAAGMQRERAATDGHDRLASYEFRTRLPDGSWRWIGSQSIAMRDEHGRPRRRIGVNWDASAAHAAREARLETETAQRESRAKSQFLARASHELRTPLNAVLGFTQLMRSRLADGADATTREHLDHVQRAGEHLLAMVNDLLDLAQIESGQATLRIAPAALAPVFDEVRQRVAPLAATAGVALEVEEPVALHVRADPIRLSQALVNLAARAVRRCPYGGRVTLSARPADPACVAVVLRDGSGAVGAPPKQMFEPFEPDLPDDDAAAGGSGVELAVARVLVERMGGTLAATGGDDGREFRLELPAADAAAAGVTDAGRPRDTEGRSSARLLYIEDNAVNRLIVEELLNQHPRATLRSAPDGLQGLELARSWQPDLVLLDIHLPDIDGFEVLRRLRADPATAGLRCVALSANALPAEIERAREAGFADYWTKPIDFDHFVEGLDRLL